MADNQDITTAGATVPTTSGDGLGGSYAANIQSIINSAGKDNITAAPYTISSGGGSTPHPNYRQPLPMANTNNQPISGNLHDRKMAQQRDMVGGITNALNSYMNVKNQQKNAALSTGVADISKAQAKIAEAQQVAQQPGISPELKKQAQDVIDSQKKFIEGKFEDKKVAKDLQKAFDISFVDPSKNNTPEVKAGQAGVQQAKESIAQGLHHDTPAEKAVGTAATQLSKGVTGQPSQQPQAPQSNTPYADQFLAKQPKELVANPQYQQQLAQQQAQQKAVFEHVLPRVIDAMSKQSVANLHEQGALARNLSTTNAALKIAQQKFENALKVQGLKDTTELSRQAMADRANLVRTQLRAQTALDISKQKGIVGTWKEQAAKEKALGFFTDQNSKLDAQNKTINDQILLEQSKQAKGDPLAADAILRLQNQRDYNNDMIAVNTDNRKKMANEIYGASVGGNPTGNVEGYQKDAHSKSTTDTKPITDGPTGSGPADDSAAEDKAIDDPATQALISGLISEE